MRIDRAEPSPWQRRRISRMVRRLIPRETSEIDCLVNELRQDIAEMRESAEIQRRTRYYNMPSGEDRHGGPHEHDMMRQDDDDHFWSPASPRSPLKTTVLAESALAMVLWAPGRFFPARCPNVCCEQLRSKDSQSIVERLRIQHTVQCVFPFARAMLSVPFLLCKCLVQCRSLVCMGSCNFELSVDFGGGSHAVSVGFG